MLMHANRHTHRLSMDSLSRSFRKTRKTFSLRDPESCQFNSQKAAPGGFKSLFNPTWSGISSSPSKPGDIPVRCQRSAGLHKHWPHAPNDSIHRKCQTNARGNWKKTKIKRSEKYQTGKSLKCFHPTQPLMIYLTVLRRKQHGMSSGACMVCVEKGSIIITEIPERCRRFMLLKFGKCFLPVFPAQKYYLNIELMTVTLCENFHDTNKRFE